MSEALAWIILSGAGISLALAAIRLVRGPSQADRIVALDIVLSANLALTSAASLASGRTLFLDIGVGVSLVAFVATVVWSRAIDAHPRRRPRRDEAPGDTTGQGGPR